MRFQLAILALTTALVPLSFVGAPYPQELVLQHGPTLAILLGLAALVRFTGISTASFACVECFLLLHILGARWIYSFVPYDDWAQTLTGTTLSARFGWERNHYDRLVHFALGLLGVWPVAEYVSRLGKIRTIGAALVGVASVLAIGSIYEVLEWQVAVTLAPSHAEAYNGQQGDIWDPQKDMALQWLGATCTAVVVIVFGRAKQGES